MTVYQSSLLQATTEVYSSPAGRWITAAFSMSVATNVIASSLIAFRLATLSKAVKSLGGPRSRGGLKVSLVPAPRSVEIKTNEDVQ